MADTIALGTANHTTLIAGGLTHTGIPTSDPTVAGAVWLDGVTLKVSAG